jgi:hypothetical protein
MPYIYKGVRSLQDHPLVDGGDCVALVKAYAPGLKGRHTSTWKEGARVIDVASELEPGTAIATFVRGRYPQAGTTGKHAAFFIKSAGSGIWVMDQWKNDPHKPRVSMRHISRAGRREDGTYTNPSNNAEAFSVIER